MADLPNVSKSRVFIANVGYHDYSAAERFGKLVAVTRAKVDLEHSDRMEAEIQDALADFNSDDYLLLSGPPLINILAAGFIFKRLGEVRVVYWDGLMRDYHVRELTFETRELAI